MAEAAGKHLNADTENRINNIKVFYWNGGGSMAARLRVNPLLNEVLNSKPDIFAYAECLVYKSIASPLPHYSLILHKAQKKTKRRGIAIFVKNEYTHNVTTDLPVPKMTLYG